MLFDYDKDPDEERNVAGLPEYKDILNTLQKLLDERIQQSLD